MGRTGRGFDRGVVVLAAALAAVWLVVAVKLHAGLLAGFGPGGDLGGAWARFVGYGAAALVLVGTPATLVGWVAVAATAGPASTRASRRAARVAFAVSATGPVEAAVVAVVRFFG